LCFCHFRKANESSSGCEEIIGHFGKFRELELELKLFNLAFSDVLWLFKLTCWNINILAGFAAIQLIKLNPPLATIYAFFFLVCIVLYIAIFGLAFGVTQRTDEFREVAQLSIARLRVQKSRKYCQRILRSLPKLAMRVGGFHAVERESVPIYVDFVFKQIVSLLLAFK
jgi:hypothetical protein